MALKFTRLVGGIPNFLNKSKIARRFVYFVFGLILLKLFYNAIFWSDDKIPSIAERISQIQSQIGNKFSAATSMGPKQVESPSISLNELFNDNSVDTVDNNKNNNQALNVIDFVRETNVDQQKDATIVQDDGSIVRIRRPKSKKRKSKKLVQTEGGNIVVVDSTDNTNNNPVIIDENTLGNLVAGSVNGDPIILDNKIIDGNSVNVDQTSVNTNNELVLNGVNEALNLIDDKANGLQTDQALVQNDGSVVRIRRPKMKKRKNRKLVQTESGDLVIIDANANNGLPGTNNQESILV